MSGSRRTAVAAAIYDGRTLLGEVTPAAGGSFVARDATGRMLGKFADMREASKVITAHARSSEAPR